MARYNRRDFIKALGIGSAALALPMAAQTLPANGAVPRGPGARASVTPSGEWQVSVGDLGWTFGGTVGAAATGISTTSGRDALGAYTQTAFGYQAGGTRRAEIRTYLAAPIVIFTDTYVDAAANSGAFPTISTYPALPHTLSHQGCFGHYQFNSTDGAADSPWLFFDGTGNTFAISAANHFQQAEMTMAANHAIAAGVLASITELPAGFARQTILVLGKGIDDTYRRWGGALTTLTGKRRPDSDAGPLLNTLGYWTDHGAVYYYAYDTSLGYTGTLQAVADEWAAKKIPLGYLQLDSWWYPKGPQADWTDNNDGEYLYEADATLFPNGLAAFQKQIGVPLVTHARWLTASSPYRTEFQTSNNVVTDPAFWQKVMSYLRDAGVIVYEQDWLCSNAQPDYNLTDPDAFFDNMAHNAATEAMTMQYCMALPRDYLQSTRYDNLTTIRVSDDRFEPTKWDEFLYDSQLAASLGVWPWTDVFMSTETTNLLLANLSAGPVGVGDGLGQVNPANLFQVARPDGVIVKPDAPIVPTDATYLADAAGTRPAMVAATHVEHASGLRYAYVFSYARQLSAPAGAYQAEAATLSGAVAAHDNSGYTGIGYADYQNSSGDYVQWSVDVAGAGDHVLAFRYANGDTAARPLAITVNGTDAGTLPFAPTGGWASWDFQTMTVALPAGGSTIRATATGASGGNVDYLDVTQGTPIAPNQAASFTPTELGITNRAYVYDYFAGTGQLVASGARVDVTVTDGSYWIVAPVGPSGIAFLGDAGKFVAHGDKRIPHLTDDGTLHVTVQFTPGEGAIVLHGYAPTPPSAVATSGGISATTYDTTTQRFALTVTASANHQATLTVRR
ncbi:MAG TPA: carbohydrate-binding protein [Pseudonocardiaceae bacterium]